MKGDDLPQNAADFSDEDQVFDRIARRYDRLCDIFSFGIHRLWKRRMAAAVMAEPAALILDGASGTGDIPHRLISKMSPGHTPTVLVTDISVRMLEMAEAKLGPETPTLKYLHLDAYDMAAIKDASVDVYSFAFAMKICDRERILAEALRVLKPGGVFYCLEASTIPVKAIQTLYLTYMDWCMPIVGQLATGGDASAYK